MIAKRTFFRYAIPSVVAFFPFIPFSISSRAKTIANENGCSLHEGFVNPCIVDGIVIGEKLYSDFVMLWLVVFGTLPALICVGILAAMMIFDLVRWRRMKNGGSR